jgi:hypothetical protein
VAQNVRKQLHFFPIVLLHREPQIGQLSCTDCKSSFSRNLRPASKEIFSPFHPEEHSAHLGSKKPERRLTKQTAETCLERVLKHQSHRTRFSNMVLILGQDNSANQLATVVKPRLDQAFRKAQAFVPDIGLTKIGKHQIPVSIGHFDHVSWHSFFFNHCSLLTQSL